MIRPSDNDWIPAVGFGIAMLGPVAIVVVSFIALVRRAWPKR